MANIHQFDENVRRDKAMAMETLSDSSNTPEYFSMASYDLAVFLIETGTLTAAAAITATIWESDGTTPQATSVSQAGYQTDDDGFVLQIRGEELSVNSGYSLVGILVTETVDQNAVVEVILLRMRARFKQATMPA